LTTTTTALLGGAFNPIHFGHLRLATEVLNTTRIETVQFMPYHTPVHREAPSVGAIHRVAMLQQAIQGHPEFTYQDYEITLGKPSYTVDTVTALSQHTSNHIFSFVMGMDAFCQIHTWHRYEALLDYAHLIIAMRPGDSLPTEGPAAELYQQYGNTDSEQLHQTHHKVIFLLEMTALDIASRHIRALLHDQKRADFLLPDPILAYIQHHQLY